MVGDGWEFDYILELPLGQLLNDRHYNGNVKIARTSVLSAKSKDQYARYQYKPISYVQVYHGSELLDPGQLMADFHGLVRTITEEDRSVEVRRHGPAITLYIDFTKIENLPINLARNIDQIVKVDLVLGIPVHAHIKHDRTLYVSYSTEENTFSIGTPEKIAKVHDHVSDDMLNPCHLVFRGDFFQVSCSRAESDMVRRYMEETDVKACVYRTLKV